MRTAKRGSHTKSLTYKAPAYWASYLINGDASGLEDNEKAACDAWLGNLPAQWCVSASEESEFIKYHDASQFADACDCLTYTFHK